LLSCGFGEGGLWFGLGWRGEVWLEPLSMIRWMSRPGWRGMPGCLRDRACMAVFSSRLIRTVPGGGFR
jgi:hypothetical protein